MWRMELGGEWKTDGWTLDFPSIQRDANCNALWQKVLLQAPETFLRLSPGLGRKLGHSQSREPPSANDELELEHGSLSQLPSS